MCNSHKVNRWCNNHNHKYFGENHLSETTPFIESPRAIIYQLSNHHSQQYINYHCKNNLLYCCSLCFYVIVLYLFYIKWFFINLFSFHIQTKDSDMHVYVHSWLLNDCDRNQPNNQFLGLFFCNMLLYWLTISCISVTFFYW